MDKLGRVINDMTPVSELPFNVRPKTRKEKNKLASRACRLKKKAQHEANKIKLQGLEAEHSKFLVFCCNFSFFTIFFYYRTSLEWNCPNKTNNCYEVYKTSWRK